MSAKLALREAIAQLKEAGIESPAADARALLAYALGIAPARISLHLDDPFGPKAEARFKAAVSARLGRQPVAQIIGQRLFWGRVFKVTPDTLDPRPETEILVEQAVSVPFEKIMDLGLGTGCILLSCLADMPQACGIGVDISQNALNVAQENATALGVAKRASFYQSNWFEALGAEFYGQFDLITSNPPYIAADEMAGLSPEVLDWEPHLALTPGGDGLAPYRIIAAESRAYLRPKGRLMVEIGPTQGPAVRAMFEAAGFEGVAVLPDWDQRDRVVLGYAPA